MYAVGRTAEAVEHFRRAIAIEPAYANAHNNLGKALEGLGRIDESIAEYDQALRIQPDNPQTRENMAGALVRADRTREALGHYETVLGDFRHLFALQARLPKIDAQAVQRAAQRHLDPAQRTVLVAKPSGEADLDDESDEGDGGGEELLS